MFTHARYKGNIKKNNKIPSNSNENMTYMQKSATTAAGVDVKKKAPYSTVLRV